MRPDDTGDAVCTTLYRRTLLLCCDVFTVWQRRSILALETTAVAPKHCGRLSNQCTVGPSQMVQTAVYQVQSPSSENLWEISRRVC